MKKLNRSSGVLLHITSLPGSYGIGEIGPQAFKFVDDLAEMNQKLWQILPDNPTDNYNCPYGSISAFANNPLLISLDFLIRDGWLSSKDLKNYRGPGKTVCLKVYGLDKKGNLVSIYGNFHSILGLCILLDSCLVDS